MRHLHDVSRLHISHTRTKLSNTHTHIYTMSEPKNKYSRFRRVREALEDLPPGLFPLSKHVEGEDGETWLDIVRRHKKFEKKGGKEYLKDPTRKAKIVESRFKDGSNIISLQDAEGTWHTLSLRKCLGYKNNPRSDTPGTREHTLKREMQEFNVDITRRQLRVLLWHAIRNDNEQYFERLFKTSMLDDPSVFWNPKNTRQRDLVDILANNKEGVPKYGCLRILGWLLYAHGSHEGLVKLVKKASERCNREDIKIRMVDFLKTHTKESSKATSEEETSVEQQRSEYVPPHLRGRNTTGVSEKSKRGGGRWRSRRSVPEKKIIPEESGEKFVLVKNEEYREPSVTFSSLRRGRWGLRDRGLFSD